MNLQGNKVIFVGLQYGSEAKGLAIERFTQKLKPKYAVRTGAVNAGHSVFYNGHKYAMQTIPVSWIDPTVKLILGAGTIIDTEILDREIKIIEKAQPLFSLRGRLFIDQNCYLQQYHHAVGERGMHASIGSTGKGCGEALIEKIQRSRGTLKLFRESNYCRQNNNIKFEVVDTVEMLCEADVKGEIIFLEGTQGTGLDFNLGHYPYVTSRMTTASAWLAEAGLPPKNAHVVGIARTFPIRVAGNSGPMKNEISWSWLAQDINKKRETQNLPPIVKENALVQWDEACARVAGKWRMPTAEIHTLSEAQRLTYYKEISNFHFEALSMLAPDVVDELKKLLEMTTVTKKVRRIGILDINQLQRAVKINGCDGIVLNFLNYRLPHLWDSELLDAEAVSYLKELEREVGNIPIVGVSTSAQKFVWI